MDVLLEHISEDRLPVWMPSACTAEVKSRVLDSQAVTVVLSGDFKRSVSARRVGKDDEYTTDRTFGEAIAKTMPGDDGHISILFNVPLAREEQIPEEYMRRMAGHEAYHAVIDQRGETSHAIRERHGLEAYTGRGTFGELASYAVEEYRAERALCEEGLPLHSITLRAMGDVLDAFTARLRSAVITDKDLIWTVQMVLTAFHHVSMYLAYRAADELTGGPPPGDDAGSLWRKLVGRDYDRFRDALSAVPSAATPTTFEELDPLTFAVADVMQDWLAHVGFTVEDRERGFYFDILRHDF